MSKFEIVRRALEENPGVVVVHLDKKTYFPCRDGYFTETADFYVAPRQGLFTANLLQGFMEGLVPGLAHTSIDNFYQKKDRLQFGMLYFDEKIGEERVVTHVTHRMSDPGFSGMQIGKGSENAYGLDEQGVVVLESDNTFDHRRRTWVRPFPTEKVARDVLEERLESSFEISLADLRRYASGILIR